MNPPRARTEFVVKANADRAGECVRWRADPAGAAPIAVAASRCVRLRHCRVTGRAAVAMGWVAAIVYSIGQRFG